MARKLPWAADSSVSKRTASPGRNAAPKRGRIDAPDTEVKVEDTGTPKSTPPTTPRKQRMKAPLDSSPMTPHRPKSPPPVIFMLEGYDKDDAFVMVEDELYTVAHSYTLHLHQAELEKARQKAKQAPPKVLPDLNPSMSMEVREKLRRDRMRRDQKTGLSEFTGGQAEDEGDEKEMRQGSNLEGLLAGGSQQKTSLIGLERLPSSTRAAKGYGKRETTNSERNRDVAGVNAEDEHDELVEDLSSYEGQSKVEVKQFGPSTLDPDRQIKRARTEISDKSQRKVSRTTSRPTVTGYRSRLDALDELEDVVFDPPPARPKKERSYEPKSPTKEPKKDRKSRLDEIPFFIG